MHRRRPGRRARGVRLPGTIAFIGLSLVAGCRSGSRPSSSAPPSSEHASTPPASPGPIGLPIEPSPSPAQRTIKRPAGAKLVDFDTCIAPVTVIPEYLRKQIFDNGDRSVQEQQFAQIGDLVTPQLKTVRQARSTWLADGYPASFPVVRDLDDYIAIYEKFLKAAKTDDLDAVPHLYTELNKINAQYNADADERVCKQ